MNIYYLNFDYYETDHRQKTQAGAQNTSGLVWQIGTFLSI